MIQSLSTDFLIRIKNSSISGRKSLTAPHSSFVESIASLLKKYSLISDFSVDGDKIKTIKIKLAYNGYHPVISDVKLFSKPGRRFYSTASALPWGQSRSSLIIVSTSSGVMSQKEAAKKNLGGEIIAEIC